MTPRRFDKLRSVLDRRQTSLTVLLENVHKPHNLSAILRTCDAVGVWQAHAVDPSLALETYHLTSASAAQWVPVQLHPDIGAAAASLRAAGMQIVAAHLSDDAVDFRAFDFTQPTAILLGAEKDGVSAAALACSEARVRVPMLGAVQSLNVSVAAAIILFEAQRQRAAAGMYERRQLADDVHSRVLFEWAYPEIAAHCRKHRASYPALDADGEIVGTFPR